MTEKSQNRPVVTRFAPSPTGLLHAGNYRTALFCYIFARQHGGKFILRIEDTDKNRSKKEFEDNIIETLKWLELSYDEMHRQSDRRENHRSYLKKLIDEGKAYVSKEEVTAEKRSEVIRFKNPNCKVTFTDLIRGDVTFDTTELGDFIIAKSLDEPVFHLAVVADDFDMGVTHVIRGEDHISNTARHILIQQAIGAPTPIYAHVPLVLAPDRSKLSKRKGALPLTHYRDQGYLKGAMINFLALIGWNPGTDEELFTTEELIKRFDLSRVQKSGAIFNIEKLNWLNKEWIKKMSAQELEKIISEKLSVFKPSPEVLQKLTPIVVDRITTFGDIDTLVKDGELDYFFNEPTLQKEKILWAKEPDVEKTKTHLEEVIKILTTWESNTNIKDILMPYAEKEGRGSVLWPVRYSLSGKEKSPDPFTLISILGKETSIARLTKAIHVLS